MSTAGRALMLCLLLLALPAPFTHAAASAPPIFPPASVFTLPKSAVGASVTICVPCAEHRPSNSLAQTWYGFSLQHTNYSYSITTFRSAKEAEQDDKRDRGNVLMGSLQLQQAPGEWIIVQANTPMSGGNWGSVYLGFAYRNLSVYVLAQAIYYGSGASRTRQLNEAHQLALNIAALLYARAQAFAAHPSAATLARLLYPTPDVFQHEGYSVSREMPQSLVSWHARDDYSYQDTYSSLDYDSYEVITFDTRADATAYNGASYEAPWKQVPVPTPLAPGERAWFQGEGDPDAICTLLLTVAYDNLVLDSTVANQCTGDTDHPALIPSGVQRATALLSFLLVRAHSYAATAPTSFNSQRNSAFVALVHDLNRRLTLCRNTFAPTYQAFLRLVGLVATGQGNPQQVISLTEQVGDACNSYPFFTIPGTGPPEYRLDPTLENDASVRHLVYTDVSNALETRENSALSMLNYAESIQRGIPADALGRYYNAAVTYARKGPGADMKVQQDIAAIARRWPVSF